MQDNEWAVPVGIHRFELTEECARSLAYLKRTVDLRRMPHKTEKEHLADCQSAPTDIPIVTVPAG